MTTDKETKTALPEGIDAVYMGEEAIRRLEEQNQKKIQLPPKPEGVLPYTEDDKKNYFYDGDEKDIHLRLKWKLFNLWSLWGLVRNNEKLVKVVNKIDDKDDLKSDEVYLKNMIVNIIDVWGKIMAATHITEEIFNVHAEHTPPQ